MDVRNTEPTMLESSPPRYTVRLENFEGPLDLLLHLIKQEEVDIWDIPIARITEQYLEYLKMFEELDINPASEFIVMAATLIYIKSRLLLPPDPDKTEEEEVEDPHRELVYQLLEHQKFKNAAQMLYSKETVENSVWPHPPVEIRQEEDEVLDVTIFDLVSAFKHIVERIEAFSGLEVKRESFTIEEKIDELRQMLLVRGEIKFSTYLSKGLSRQHIIVIFLAILELARLREIRFLQKKIFGEIYIRKTETRTVKGKSRCVEPSYGAEE